MKNTPPPAFQQKSPAVPAASPAVAPTEAPPWRDPQQNENRRFLLWCIDPGPALTDTAALKTCADGLYSWALWIKTVTEQRAVASEQQLLPTNMTDPMYPLPKAKQTVVRPPPTGLPGFKLYPFRQEGEETAPLPTTLGDVQLYPFQEE